jgi:hypothetical protein
MVDERVGHILRPNMAKSVACAPHKRPKLCPRQEAVVNTIYFLLAVAAASTAIFALMMRADKRRGTSSDSGSSDPGVSSTNDGWVASWFGPTHSSDISGSWDSGGWSGGDSGGGAGGGSND